MGKIIEGFWDCKYCKAIKISADNRECPHCGHARGKEVKFYVSEGARVLSEQEAKKISQKPDWCCSYCGSYNSDNVSYCNSCGNSRSKDDKNYHEINNNKDIIYRKPEETRKSKEQLSKNVDENDIDEQNKKDIKKENFAIKIKKQWKKIAVCFITLIIICGLIKLFIPKYETMQIKQFSWQSTIEIEEYKTCSESDWSLPTGARLLYTTQEISRYEQVIDHYEEKTRQISEEVLVGYDEQIVGYKDKGNGYFEEITKSVPKYETRYKTEKYSEPIYREEPIYQTKYYYEIERWIPEREVSASKNDHNPYNPEYKLSDKERVAKETSVYKVKVVSNTNKEYEIAVDYAQWEKLELGQDVTVKTVGFLRYIVS